MIYHELVRTKSKATIKVSAFVTPEQKKTLDAISARTGAPLVFIVRKAIDAYLEQEQSVLRRKSR
jgi:predicted DNA-binding protein